MSRFSMLLGFVLCSFWSCEKDDAHILPNVPVNARVLINNSAFPDFINPGGHAYINAGIQGIVVYHFTTTEYVAFDRACTYKPEDECRVEFNGSLLECPCCGSTFSVLDGAVIKGPAEWFLRRYEARARGAYVHVVN